MNSSSLNNNGERIIRPATPADYAAIRNIYAPYITNTTITFEYEIPTEEEFAQRMQNIAHTYPILICEVDSRIIGYAYGATFKPRTAYQWVAESVIYLTQDSLSRGIGKSLYHALIEVLRLQGICQAIAVVTSENEKSLDFHKKMGFVPSAKLKNVGFKFGQWLDVDWLQYNFAKLQDHPEPIRSFQEIYNSTEFKTLLYDINRRLNY